MDSSARLAPAPVARGADDISSVSREDEVSVRGERTDATGEPHSDGSSPLLGGLLEQAPEVLATHVLSRLDRSDLAMFSRVSRACATAAAEWVAEAEEVLVVKDFVHRLERLAWAKANGCPWEDRTAAIIARHGVLEALMWATEHECPRGYSVYTAAALGGRLHVLSWLANVSGKLCPWDGCATAAAAASGGWLETLQWLRGQGCPWDWRTCFYARMNGRLEVLRWARENGCPEITHPRDVVSLGT